MFSVFPDLVTIGLTTHSWCLYHQFCTARSAGGPSRRAKRNVFRVFCLLWEVGLQDKLLHIRYYPSPLRFPHDWLSPFNRHQGHIRQCARSILLRERTPGPMHHCLWRGASQHVWPPQGRPRALHHGGRIGSRRGMCPLGVVCCDFVRRPSTRPSRACSGPLKQQLQISTAADWPPTARKGLVLLMNCRPQVWSWPCSLQVPRCDWLSAIACRRALQRVARGEPLKVGRALITILAGQNIGTGWHSLCAFGLLPRLNVRSILRVCFITAKTN